ncbi:hypothetical protein N9444_08770 [Gammaproteobacteria bacterium]|nr:hypothetical protein [Gammaproteobacteria bacterium]
MKKLILSLALLLVCGVASAERWLCVPEKVMGLDSEGEWKTINVSNSKNWVVTDEQSSESSRSISYVVRETGRGLTTGNFRCETQETDLPQLECYDPKLRDLFRFNKNTNLYARTGFLSDLVGETKDYTPLIELGKCSHGYKRLTDILEDLNRAVDPSDAPLGAPRGYGTYLSSDGKRFIGKFTDGLPIHGLKSDREGNIVSHYMDGQEHMGLFFSGLTDQKTIEIWLGTYTGQVSNGLPHGRGSYVVLNKVWIGEWKNGERHGRGMLVTSLGVVVGEYTAGLLSHPWQGVEFRRDGVRIGTMIEGKYTMREGCALNFTKGESHVKCTDD